MHLSWPVAGTIGQTFGPGHYGIDILTAWGTPVHASADGTVLSASEGWNGGFGTMVEVDHGNGIVTRYPHLSSFSVTVGQHVSRGEVIARVGQTGIATAPHVHFEVVNNGVRSDPMPYLR
jgi:murein DD-endopeptidase MepM/ murein hydrolase activator NlpD